MITDDRRRVGETLSTICVLLVIAVGFLMTAYATDGTRPRPAEPQGVPAIKSPLAARSAMTAVVKAGERLVAVGQRGHILHSDDGGKTWIQAQVPVSVDLVAVHFPTPTAGWAAGHDGVVLRSDDAGETWTLMLDGRQAAQLLVDFYSSLEGQDEPVVAAAIAESKMFAEEQGARPFLDVWFEDAQSGFVIGAWGLILRTDDGGATWEPWMHRVDNPESLHLNAIDRAADGQSVWIVGERGLLLRLDAHAGRFVSMPVPEGGSLFGLVPLPDGILAYGLGGHAVVSHDQGRTWDAPAGLGTSGLTGGYRLPDGRLVLVDVGAGAWISRDEGRTFSQLPLHAPMPYADVIGIDSDTLVLAGIGGMRVQAISP